MDKGRRTIPVDNFFMCDEKFWRFWTERMSFGVYAVTDNLVQKHKDRFGPQTYCWTNTRRYWVWEFDGYRIYVANGYGVQIEVEPEITGSEDVKAIMLQYLEDITS